MGRPLFIAIILVTLCAEGGAAPTKKGSPQPSLLFSCLQQNFVSISASAPSHDSIPQVGISVSDPLGRMYDYATNRNSIPHSRYGNISQIQKQPERSLAVSLEICAAEPGTYEVKLTELGAKPYRLTVSAFANASTNESLVLQHVSREGRSRNYRFVLRKDNDHLILKWLCGDGSECSMTEASEW
jgi:hypothetical protein